MGRYKLNEFTIKDVQPTPDGFNPFVMFEALGSSYYLQGIYFRDKKLLRKFVGKQLEGDQTKYEEWE